MVFAVVGCAHHNDPVVAASPAPIVSAFVASIASPAIVLPAPASAPTSAPPKSPSVAPSAGLSAPVASVAVSEPGPRIYGVSASPSVVHAGQSIAFDVRTSSEVASVDGAVSSYTLHFTRTSPGRFALAFAIPPNVPGVFHGTYAMNVTARDASGASAVRSVAITFE